MENNELEQRLIALEIKFAYIEDFLQQIQEVTVAQTTGIDRLRAENKAMAIKITEMSDQLESDIPNRRPPHY